MRKYPYINQNGAYDKNKIIQLCFDTPTIIKNTYAYQDKLIALLGNAFRNEEEERLYREEIKLIFTSCLRLEEFLKKDNRISRKIRSICSDLCLISNIRQQMGAFYLANTAMPFFTDIETQSDISDPQEFIKLAPDIIKLSTLALNVITLNHYSSKLECERMELLQSGTIADEKTIWWHNGALVTLVYAISNLKIDGMIIDIGPSINETVNKIACATFGKNSNNIFWSMKPNLPIIVKHRHENIKTIYSTYTKEEILKADSMSPIKQGSLPSKDEIEKALLS